MESLSQDPSCLDGQRSISLQKRVLKTPESISPYSYWYSVKISGVTQSDLSESAEKSIEICLDLFKQLKATLNPQNIDIACLSVESPILLNLSANVLRGNRKEEKKL